MTILLEEAMLRIYNYRKIIFCTVTFSYNLESVKSCIASEKYIEEELLHFQTKHIKSWYTEMHGISLVQKCFLPFR